MRGFWTPKNNKKHIFLLVPKRRLRGGSRKTLQKPRDRSPDQNRWIAVGGGVFKPTPAGESVRGPPDAITRCYAILLPGRKSAFRAGFWPDCYRENTKVGPPASRRPAGGPISVFSGWQSGQSPARKADLRPGRIIAQHRVGCLIVLPVQGLGLRGRFWAGFGRDANANAPNLVPNGPGRRPGQCGTGVWSVHSSLAHKTKQKAAPEDRPGNRKRY